MMINADVSSLPYGINCHLSKNDVLAKIKNAGIKWIRIDIDWSVAEPSNNKYNFTEIDRVINYAHSNGLSVLAIIAYTPDWANNKKGSNYPPDNIQHWKDFVHYVVKRYKSKVKYWNIWNEPNLERFFALKKDAFVNQIFLPAAKIIRGLDSGAFIVGPELSHHNSEGHEWYFWLKYILTTCKDYIDIVSHHIYKDEGVYYVYEVLQDGEQYLPSVMEIIEETGHGSKPFWITEIGWHTAKFSENVQAERYLEMLQWRKKENYPNKLFFYEIIATPGTGIDPFGILRSNLKEKPAYGVYRDYVAGKYPDLPADDDDNANKKCYVEETVDSSNVSLSQNFMSDLRDFRNVLNRFSNSTKDLVEHYYKLSGEMVSLSLSDSRIYRLSLKIMSDLNKLSVAGKGIKLKMKLDDGMILGIKTLIVLLKEKQLSKSMLAIVEWGERQIRLIETGSIDHYLFRHADREIKVLNKSLVK